MQVPSVTELLPVLQTAIGPAILISGVGLLLLTMTNRLGRAIDRARSLVNQLASAPEAHRTRLTGQLHIIWRRARLIRLAIILTSMSALAAAILIIAIFFTALWHIETALLIGILFIICMACLIGALVIFIHDLNQSLSALKVELTGAGVDDE